MRTWFVPTLAPVSLDHTTLLPGLPVRTKEGGAKQRVREQVWMGCPVSFPIVDLNSATQHLYHHVNFFLMAATSAYVCSQARD